MIEVAQYALRHGLLLLFSFTVSSTEGLTTTCAGLCMDIRKIGIESVFAYKNISSFRFCSSHPDRLPRTADQYIYTFKQLSTNKKGAYHLPTCNILLEWRTLFWETEFFLFEVKSYNATHVQ